MARDPNSDGEVVHLLSIGDLADRTGVATATLRVWEERHGFPRPRRLPSGHRRYSEADVERVAQVLRRRDAGVRLDVAIAEAVSPPAPLPPSVFAHLRRTNPQLPVHRLTKGTLIAMSWAIEDEFCAQAPAAHLYGAFQRPQYYEHARARWEDLARTAASAVVFADFADDDLHASPHEIALHPGSPMRREWAVVCDADTMPAVLTAFEVPGQSHVPDGQRDFEAVWSLDPADVSEAVRVCRAVARHALTDGGLVADDDALEELVAQTPSGQQPEPAGPLAVAALHARMIAYIDRRMR